ncbi:MAG: hypothetical protein ACOYB8_06595 [Eubacteriaceae bacterium]
MIDYEPILKFEITEGPDKGQFIEMHLSEFEWPKGGKGTCPKCGSPVTGTGKDWKCSSEDCGLTMKGPIF